MVESPATASTVVVNTRRRLIGVRAFGAYLASGWRADPERHDFPHLAVYWPHESEPVVPEGEP